MSEGTDWDSFMHSYDQMMGSSPWYLEMVGAAADALNGCPRVLDSGCGPGHLTSVLRQRNHSVYAIDSSQSALDRTREVCGKTLRANLRLCDAHKLPFGDGFFSGIASLLVLCSSPDPAAYVREHARVLRHGGRLVVAGPDRRVKESFENNRHRYNRPKMENYIVDFIKYMDANCDDPDFHWFDGQEVAHLVESAGLRVESVSPNPLYNWNGEAGYFLLARA